PDRRAGELRRCGDGRDLPPACPRRPRPAGRGRAAARGCPPAGPGAPDRGRRPRRSRPLVRVPPAAGRVVRPPHRHRPGDAGARPEGDRDQGSRPPPPGRGSCRARAWPLTLDMQEGPRLKRWIVLLSIAWLAVGVVLGLALPRLYEA